ncbi:hypothetical protein FQR65_LT18683 [Abscondita terminalis]|nr:hypothetical protein FQR65_LT18683 [Abscondita terminalis]
MIFCMKSTEDLPVSKYHSHFTRLALHVHRRLVSLLQPMASVKLIEAGKLKLNEPLTTLFPGFPYPEITVEMLLKQRSGLPKYEHFLEDAKVPTVNYISNKFILDFIIKNKPELARKPDTGFMYCNTNFALLALDENQNSIYDPGKEKIAFLPEPLHLKENTKGLRLLLSPPKKKFKFVETKPVPGGLNMIFEGKPDSLQLKQIGTALSDYKIDYKPKADSAYIWINPKGNDFKDASTNIKIFF